MTWLQERQGITYQSRGDAWIADEKVGVGRTRDSHEGGHVELLQLIRCDGHMSAVFEGEEEERIRAQRRSCPRHQTEPISKLLVSFAASLNCGDRLEDPEKVLGAI